MDIKKYMMYKTVWTVDDLKENVIIIKIKFYLFLFSKLIINYK